MCSAVVQCEQTYTEVKYLTQKKCEATIYEGSIDMLENTIDRKRIPLTPALTLTLTQTLYT